MSQSTGTDEPSLIKIEYGLKSERVAAIVDGLAPHAKAHQGVQSWHQFMTSVLPFVASIKQPSFEERGNGSLCG